MADIEKITANGTTYDIADATAREDIEDLKNDVSELNTNKVSKSGDTMTGDLIISESNNSDTYVRVSNTEGGCQLQTSAAGARGIWDNKISQWTVRRAYDTDNTSIGDSSTSTNIIGSTVQINGTAISSLISTQSVSADNISVTADSYASGTIDCSRSGYTALGVVGYVLGNASSSGINGSRCYATYMRLNSSTTVQYQVSNRNSSGDAKLLITVYVLYIKN